ncbi:hypothetical protein J32TS6_11360 [Virgibacillus pantothenticus]|nr:hypothetical protein J32TS6_11360 [Virgibacillus pantothenticus]
MQGLQYSVWIVRLKSSVICLDLAKTLVGKIAKNVYKLLFKNKQLLSYTSTVMFLIDFAFYLIPYIKCCKTLTLGIG